MDDALERPNRLPEIVAGIWWLILLQGIASIVLGGLLLFQPELTLLLFVQFVGIYLLVTGIFMVIMALMGRTEEEPWAWVLLRGILSILAGLIVLANPLIGIALATFFLVYFLAIAALISGVLDLIAGLRRRETMANENSLMISGLLLILVGLLLIFAPVFSLKILVLAVGISAIVGGIGLIFYAFRLRSLGKEQPAG